MAQVFVRWSNEFLIVFFVLFINPQKWVSRISLIVDHEKLGQFLAEQEFFKNLRLW